MCDTPYTGDTRVDKIDAIYSQQLLQKMSDQADGTGDDFWPSFDLLGDEDILEDDIVSHSCLT